MERLLGFFGENRDPRLGGADSFCDRLNCRYVKTPLVRTIQPLYCSVGLTFDFLMGKTYYCDTIWVLQTDFLIFSNMRVYTCF